MNDKLLLSIKNYTDTLIEQTKTKPQETFEFKMNKQMQTFSFSPSINLSEKGKWLLTVTSFEATNSVFNTIDENNSFSITIESHWSSSRFAETLNKLQKLLQLISKNDIKLHVEEARKRGNQIKIGDKENKLSDFDTRKKETILELKSTEYNDLEDMVFRMELTYNDIEKLLDVKYSPTSSTGYTTTTIW